MILYDNESQHFFILGSNGNKNSTLRYDQKTVKALMPMPQEKTFFTAVMHDSMIYTFGGYDAYDKV